MSSTSELSSEDLLKLARSKNTNQFRDVPLDELADWIKEQDLTAEVLMISLLSDISYKLDVLKDVVVDLKINNMHLALITGETLTDSDIEN